MTREEYVPDIGDPNKVRRNRIEINKQTRKQHEQQLHHTAQIHRRVRIRNKDRQNHTKRLCGNRLDKTDNVEDDKLREDRLETDEEIDRCAERNGEDRVEREFDCHFGEVVGGDLVHAGTALAVDDLPLLEDYK